MAKKGKNQYKQVKENNENTQAVETKELEALSKLPNDVQEKQDNTLNTAAIPPPITPPRNQYGQALQFIRFSGQDCEERQTFQDNL